MLIAGGYAPITNNGYKNTVSQSREFPFDHEVGD
jgi:hypothetical protein